MGSRITMDSRCVYEDVSKKGFSPLGLESLWLSTLAALAADPGLILSIHTAAHNHLKLQFQGI